ncbi:transcription factor, putative [Ricinus communis]|uniref:Transcription factor, putative n=1 Tax=Ricinus communis TaxID=3988 RepID=B9R794_RICCO|nr:transcription factor, putative [Ricinus communis]|eukprot:XP_002510187.1 protein CUP-SHAPED COTYLEDON 3 [Ricinus communis]
MSFVAPGCRFYPSDEQLLCYYLTSKTDEVGDGNNDKKINGYDLIKELDLYEYEPSNLPENACYSYGYKGRRRHWYCYTKKFRVWKGEGRRRRRRKAKGGYWRSSGRVRDVVDPGGKVVIGTRSKFVFYSGNSVQSLIRTDWVLYEYALMHHVKASYVLCRVFVKSRAGNSNSENVLSCCAEQNVSAVRHIGIQHDGFLTPDIVEAKVHRGNSVDAENDLSKYPLGLSTKLDAFPDSNKLVRTPELPGDDMLVDAGTTQELVSILEGDFIELDDLLD